MHNNLLQQIELAELFAMNLDERFLAPGHILELHEKYGPIDFFLAHMDIRTEYFERWNTLVNVKKKRFAEVAIYVENKNGELLLHTKPFYPQDVYRIPTGGIHAGEHVIDALHRELHEETGFTANSFMQPALLVYKFQNDGRTIPFVSHIFKVKVDGGDPHPTDEDENISGYRWIKQAQLDEVVYQLETLKKDWHDWGVMRALPHEILKSVI